MSGKIGAEEEGDKEGSPSTLGDDEKQRTPPKQTEGMLLLDWTREDGRCTSNVWGRSKVKGAVNRRDVRARLERSTRALSPGTRISKRAVEG